MKKSFDQSLQPEQQEQALAKAAGHKTNLDQAVAFGSARQRSAHTAALAMVGETVDTITGSESFAELKAKIDQDLKVGSKIAVDSKLDFNFDPESPFGIEAYQAINSGDYLKFLVNRSDELAAQEHDLEVSTYSRQAGNIAKIVKKYATVSGRWGELVASGKYQDPNLERFLGTHGGVAESFLFKVIAKTKGEAERDRLIDLLADQFDYTEGFEVSITNQGQTPQLHIKYQRINSQDPEKSYTFNQDIPLELVDEIIKEAE